MKKQNVGFCASFGLSILAAVIGVLCFTFALWVEDGALKVIAAASYKSDVGRYFYWPFYTSFYAGITLLIVSGFGIIRQMLVLSRRAQAA